MSANAEELYRGLGPWQRADGEATGWLLLHLCQAIVEPLDELDELIRDVPLVAGAPVQDWAPGWSAVLDLDRVPDVGLPWLAQFVGVHGLAADPAVARDQIAQRTGWHRGRPASIVSAAAAVLTGTKSVDLFEREGSAYRFRVRTYLGETPDEPALIAAVMAEKPGGLVVEIEVTPGPSIDELVEFGPTIDELPGTIDDFRLLIPS